MLKLATLLVATALGCSASITATLTATATGSLDGNQFTNASLTLTAIANSSTPAEPSSVTVQVGSFSDTFNLESPYLFVDQGTCLLEKNVTSCAGLGSGGNDMLDISNNVFDTYTLGNPIGPVPDATPSIFVGHAFIDDSGGSLILSSAKNGTFTVDGVSAPEPSSAATLAGGILAVGIFARRRPILASLGPA
jgi:hypothetical protein